MLKILLAITIVIGIISINYGLFIREKLNIKFIKYNLPIGFFSFLGIYQIITLPLMMSHASLDYLYMITIIYLIISIFLVVYNYKKLYYYFKSCIYNPEIYLCLGIFCFFCIIYYFMNNLSTLSDFNFYIPLVNSNSNGSFINTINPWDGININLNWMYNYQSYYLFLSSLSFISKISPTLITIWVPSLLFFILYPLIIFDLIHFIFNKKFKYFCFIIVILLSFHGLYTLEFSYYGNNFRPFAMIYILLLIQSYYHSYNSKILSILIIIMMSHFSFQSTSLFISGIIVFTILIYDYIKYKLNHIYLLLTSAMPIIFYLACIIKDIFGAFIMILFLGITFIVYILFYYLFNKKRKVYNFLILGTILTIIFLIYFGSFILIIFKIETPVQIDSFFNIFFNLIFVPETNVFINVIQFVIYCIICYTFISLIIKKQKFDFLGYIGAVTLLFFYNPIVSPFVSKFLTGIVYERLDILIFSSLTVSLLIYNFKSFFFSRKGICIIFIISSVVFLNNLIIDLNSNKFYAVEQGFKFNKVYKIENDLLDIQEFLNDYMEYYYSDNQYIPAIISSDLRIRLNYQRNTLKYTVSDYRYNSTLSSDNSNYLLTLIYKIISESNSPFFQQYDLSELESLIKSFSIEFIVTEQSISDNLKHSLDTFSRLVYQNASYRIYQILY